VKQTIAKFLSSTNRAASEVELLLARNFSAVEQFAGAFLTSYFLELSLSYLRRPRGSSRLDSAFWYHFSRAGDFVSSTSEQRVKDVLREQCRERARALLPLLLWTVENDSETGEQKLGEGLLRAFGVSQPDQASPRQDGFNVVVGSPTVSVSALARSHATQKNPLKLLLHSPDANVAWSFDPLERFLKKPVHSLVKDLLDIAVVLYMSDLYTLRERELGRRLSILMPVRHREIWSRARAKIARTVAYLGRDEVEIEFVDCGDKQDPVDTLSEASGDGCVSLLSGGLDSLAGALWLLDAEPNPCFVSHYSGTAVAGIQNSLVNALRRRPALLRHIGFRVTRASVATKPAGEAVSYQLGAPPASVMFQHLRSYLFLSLAAAVALETQSRRIYMFENGPVALNPVFSEGRINTQTAHPQVLASFADLIREVFAVELHLSNPFLERTKGEVAQILRDHDFGRPAARTNSCFAGGRVRGRAARQGRSFSGSHDGDCLSCILRRVALDRAGLWKEGGRRGFYLIDVFREFPNLPRSTVTEIADYLRFCSEIKDLPPGRMLERCPDFSVYCEGCLPRKLIAMYKKHADEVLSAFEERANQRFRAVFFGR
jgi:7-cyano-7-deazaguanine synthase in queuosine biosynthesis